MASLGLPVASYSLPSHSASSAQLINCYIEQAPPDSQKSNVILRRAPGIRSWIDLAIADADVVRGLYVFQGTLYALVGQTLYAISEDGTETAVTGSVPGTERVGIADNGTDMVIWRPFDNSLYESDGATVSQLIDPMLTDGAASPGFVDGYLVFRRPDTDQFFNTGINALTFNGLDIASAEAKPGNLLGLFVDHREIILPKEDCCELWYNAGNSPGSPFSRSPDGFLELGTAAPLSFASIDNSPFWLANDLTFRRLSSVTPERVSQHGIEAITQRIDVSDCYGLQYTQEGHLFYCAVFPNAARTLVYDCTIQQWHERDSLGIGAWRPAFIVQCYGQQFVGDRVSGKIGILDPDIHTEFGDAQRVRWTYQAVYSDANRVSHKALQIVLNSGFGTATGQGVNPLMTLRISDDGGETFRTLPTKSMGRMGEYEQRIQWWKLGTSRNRVYSVDVTDPVPVFAFDTQLEAEGARL